jgi:hypothetical protein
VCLPKRPGIGFDSACNESSRLLACGWAGEGGCIDPCGMNQPVDDPVASWGHSTTSCDGVLTVGDSVTSGLCGLSGRVAMAGQGGMVKRGWAVRDYGSWPVCCRNCELEGRLV